MDFEIKSSSLPSSSTPSTTDPQNDTRPPVESATPMSPLELNDIRLDPSHTVLTPDYLENILKKTIKKGTKKVGPQGVD